MIQILNLLIDFAIIYLGNIIAPEHIIINDWKDAILAAICIFTIQFIGTQILNLLLIPLAIATIRTSLSATIIISILTVIIAIIGSIAISAGSVILTDKLLNNFTITSTTAYIVVIILTSVLSASNSSKSSNN